MIEPLPEAIEQAIAKADDLFYQDDADEMHWIESLDDLRAAIRTALRKQYATGNNDGFAAYAALLPHYEALVERAERLRRGYFLSADEPDQLDDGDLADDLVPAPAEQE